MIREYLAEPLAMYGHANNIYGNIGDTGHHFIISFVCFVWVSRLPLMKENRNTVFSLSHSLYLLCYRFSPLRNSLFPYHPSVQCLLMAANMGNF